jgi:pimeloyl-ACP methyl ester carboxylesterase
MIHALPGMGADRRMYPAPWSTLPDFIADDWMLHSGEKSLAEVAKSMCNVSGIRDGDTLVGSSLGGMVACEITKMRKIPCLYLIGSATRKEEVSALLAMIHPLARIAPIDWLRFSSSKIPAEVAQMFAGSEASFVRAMCSAIFEWDGLGVSRTKVFRIHGKHDFVIPPPTSVDLLLDGGHLISISHARHCVDFIKASQQAGAQGKQPVC